MRNELADKIRTQLFFWLGMAAIFVLFFWMFNSILLPFIAAMVLAYFLDPVADFLETLGISRILASLLILVAFVVIFVLSLMLIIPILGDQVVKFLAALPGYVERLQHLLAEQNSDWLRNIVGVDSTTLQNNLGELMKQGASWLSTIFSQIWASGKSLLSVLSLLVITPVVAFYLLVDWDHMIERVDSWLPLDHRDTIRAIIADMNTAIAGFVRGQGTLCLVLGIYYATALTFADLNFGLLIGFFVGLISFIPYVGATVGLVVSLGVATVQFWPDYAQIIIIAGIFFFGQFLEGYVLQPKLVGGSIGLHPVWLMFALFAFGALFGFTGMLIAVPASAAIAVLVRFALSQYLNSDLYWGHDMREHTAQEKAEGKAKALD